MTQRLGILQRRMKTVKELQDIVDTMKTMAALNINTYEKVDASLAEYFRVIEMAFCAVLRQYPLASLVEQKKSRSGQVGLVIFGSDQGMVGQFNDCLVAAVVKEAPLQDASCFAWCMGEKMGLKLEEAALPLTISRLERVPDVASKITRLMESMLLDIVAKQEKDGLAELLLFYNQAQPGGRYKPTVEQLLPIDAVWLQALSERSWPTNRIPEIIADDGAALARFTQEYLFIALCRACVGSIISENNSRLLVMQQASKNIEQMLGEIAVEYHEERQNLIDEELFDILFGYVAAESKPGCVKT
nr:F0F1 ATP synthase subunit gamma [uncultured Anaeromusa sp.]